MNELSKASTFIQVGNYDVAIFVMKSRESIRLFKAKSVANILIGLFRRRDKTPVLSGKTSAMKNNELDASRELHVIKKTVNTVNFGIKMKDRNEIKSIAYS